LAHIRFLMARTNLLSIVSVALLTLFASSLSSPVNALSVHSGGVVRKHADISLSKRSKAKKKRSSCKAPSSSSASLTSSSAKPKSTTSSTAKAVTTKAVVSTTKATTTKAATTTAAAPKSTTEAIAGAPKLRGKACLAWPNYDYNKLSTWQGSTVGLIYSWNADVVPGASDLGFTYAPMLWGWDNAEDFKSKAVKGYANVALGCNEPDQAGQSNMNAASGIQLWQQYMLPLADEGYFLISPAVSSAPAGKTWMADFMAGCTDCKVGGIAVHWYGTDLTEFQDYVTYWHTTYNLPVYVTEYADQDFNGGAQADSDQIWAFMEGATSWLNSQDWVAAHCWFGAMQNLVNVNPLNSLMNSAGDGPNDLGSYFINN